MSENWIVLDVGLEIVVGTYTTEDEAIEERRRHVVALTSTLTDEEELKSLESEILVVKQTYPKVGE